ncbi:hypothetical protein FRX31_016125, partial [Thalictrum thalictroides]
MGSFTSLTLQVGNEGRSIGKKYTRTYEVAIGVPLAITVDSESSVTIHERDSKEQIRVGIDEV